MEIITTHQKGSTPDLGGVKKEEAQKQLVERHNDYNDPKNPGSSYHYWVVTSCFWYQQTCPGLLLIRFQDIVPSLIEGTLLRVSVLLRGRAARLARQAHNLEVVGSNPTPASKSSLM